MHASAASVQTRLDLPELPSCRTCHPDATADDPSNPSHAIHGETVACQVCHAQAAKSCFGCHVGTDRNGLPYFQCKETRTMLKIGYFPSAEVLNTFTTP